MAEEFYDAVSGTLSAGPYVIRNRMTSTVLHMEHLDINRDGCNVLAFKQDEGQFKNQQIWWIEPLAEYGSEDEKPGDGLVYSITNPATGRSLDTNPECGNVCAWAHHGDPWQRWRLWNVIDPEHGEPYYAIASFFNAKVVDTVNINPPSGARTHIKQFEPYRQEQYWELLIPAVAFPPGWFHIQNVGTGDMLRQNYVYNAPMLAPPPNPATQSQHQEQWGFQWTLAHSKCFGSSADERNSWCIINRRTRARLSPHFGNIKVEHLSGRYDNLTWKLELDTTCNWKIINRKSGCLLQQLDVPFNGGKAVGCSDRKFSQKGGSQSWILKPPLLHVGDVSPPEYEDKKA